MLKAATIESVQKIDRMSNQHHMENVRLDVADEIEKHENTVLTISANLRQRNSNARWDKRKKEGDSFNELSGVTVTSDGEIYVLELNSGRIIEADYSHPPTCKVIASVAEKSTDLAYIQEGKSLIVCTGNSLKRVCLKTKKVNTLKPALTDFQPICITHHNLKLFVTDRQHRIIKLSLIISKSECKLSRSSESTTTATLDTPVMGVSYYTPSDQLLITLPKEKAIMVLDPNSLAQMVKIDLQVLNHVHLVSTSDNTIFLSSRSGIYRGYIVNTKVRNAFMDEEDIDDDNENDDLALRFSSWSKMVLDCVVDDNESSASSKWRNDGPAELVQLNSVNGIHASGHSLFFSDGQVLKLTTPTSEHAKFIKVMHNAHEAYGLVDKRQTAEYKSQNRNTSFASKMARLESRKEYFVDWQEEVQNRLSGKKKVSCGKYGTPASKTMYNMSMSFDSKEILMKFCGKHSIPIDDIGFLSLTTIQLEGQFGEYNSKGIVPSALEYKYKSS